jgi:hypothetical protein
MFVNSNGGIMLAQHVTSFVVALRQKRRKIDIQGVPEGKMNNLGGHSIGYSKQKMYMYMCSILNRFRDTDISLYRSKDVDKKEM